jgi:hypothetical protein
MARITRRTKFLVKTLNTVTQQGCPGLCGMDLRIEWWLRSLPLMTVAPVLSPLVGFGWVGKASLMQSNLTLVVLFSLTTMGRHRAATFVVIDTVEANIWASLSLLTKVCHSFFKVFKVLHREKRNGIYTYIIKGFVGLEREKERRWMVVKKKG